MTPLATQVFRFSLLLILALVSACSKEAMTTEQAARISALENRINELETEADLILDANDIKRLQRIYGYYLDEALWTDVAALLTEDVTAEYGNSGVYVGREHVLNQMLAFNKGRIGLEEGQLNDHLQLQPVITVASDGMSAKGRWRAFIMRGQYRESAQWSEGPYENEYRKENGVWKISRIHWYETFTAPYKGGWTALADATGQSADSGLPPADLPPTRVYAPWPAVHYPPFHYPNPVSGEPVSLPVSAP